MLRRLFTLLSGLSLGLAMAMCGLWIWSRFHEPDVWVAGYWHYTPHPHYRDYHDAWDAELITTPGRVAFRSRRRACVSGPGRYEDTPGARGKFLHHAPEEGTYIISEAEHDLWTDRAAKGTAGVRYISRPYLYALTLPDGEVAAVFAILPLLEIYRIRRRRRGIAMGLCPQCGYDLRASPDRCPECGAVPKRRAGQFA